MVDDAADNLVVLDEYLNPGEEEKEDEDTVSSSGSAVDVLTASQLSDPKSKMKTINPAEDFLLIKSGEDDDDENDEDYKPSSSDESEEC